ncbi:MAG: hypothetical protein AAGA25_03085 [Planctomycetota bacterium]
MDAETPLTLTDNAIDETVRRWLDDSKQRNERFVIGVAGIAASGKSTLAERLAKQANQIEPGVAAFIPMDGFHLRNDELIAKGWKPRKGAAFTYDAEAYIDLLRRYRALSQTGNYPLYCRDVHEPVLSDERVTVDTRIIVTEGQYLLCPVAPWSDLAEVLDACWWLDVSAETARQWLMKRDLSVGRTPEEAEAKYQRNDRLNTDMVLSARRTPDRVVRWPGVA